MSTVFYIVGILTCGVICFGVYKLIKLIEGKLSPLDIPKTPSKAQDISDLGRELGRGVVEALEEQQARELRDEELRKYAEARMREPTPVISSVLDEDRKVQLKRDDILIPEHLSERDKKILEEFYGN